MQEPVMQERSYEKALKREKLGEIDLNRNYRITNWEALEHHKPIDLTLLSNSKQQDDPRFQALIHMIQDYNDDVMNSQRKNEALHQGTKKKKFIEQIFKLLSEIMNTQDENIQNRHLNRAIQWALNYKQQTESQDDSRASEQKLNQKLRPYSSISSNSSMKGRPISGIQTESTARPESRMSVPYIQDQTQNRPATAAIKRFRPETAISSTQRFQTRPYSYLIKAKTQPFDKASIKSDSKPINLTTETRPDSAESFLTQKPPLRHYFTTDVPLTETSEQEILEDPYRLKDSEQPIIMERIEDEQFMMTPSHMISNQLNDYNDGHRTLHPDIEPPYISLQRYRRRLLSATTRPNSSKPQIIDHEWKQTIKFKTSLKKQDKQDDDLKNLAESHKSNDDEIPQELSQDKISSPAKSESSAQKDQNSDDDEMGILKEIELQKPEKQSINLAQTMNIEPQIHFGRINKAFSKEPVLQPIKTETQKTISKSNYQLYNPVQNSLDLDNEARWIKQQNQNLAKKWQDEEIANHLAQWSRAKRLQSAEISRRIESARLQSKFKKLEFHPKVYNQEEHLSVLHQCQSLNKANFTDATHSGVTSLESNSQDISDYDMKQKLEDYKQETKPFDIKFPTKKDIQDEKQVINLQHNTDLQYFHAEARFTKKRVQTALAAYGKYINLPKNSPSTTFTDTRLESINKESGLEMYTDNVQSNYRLFSAIVDSAAKQNIESQKLINLKHIQNQCGEHNVNVRLSDIAKGILVPNNYSNTDLTMLPKVGNQLIVNPLLKAKHKKHRKSRKSKR